MKNWVVWGNYGRWRIQDSQTVARLSAVAARIEAPNGLGRGEGVLLHAEGGTGERAMPFPRKKLIWVLEMSYSSAFWALFCSSAICCTRKKNTVLGLRKLAAVCTRSKRRQTETIWGTIVIYDLAPDINIIIQTLRYGPLNPPQVMGHSWLKSLESTPFF